VGGGRIESKAIQHAVKMLEQGQATDLVRWNLTTDVGMTCGGRVQLFFEVSNEASWSIAIFGAGHIAQALSQLLTSLPCRVSCIDPREDWLRRLPDGVHRIQTDSPAEMVANLTPATSIVCMTRGHRSDLPVLIDVARQPHVFPFVGVIGSRTKAAALRRELREVGIDDDAFDFECPIGLPIGGNHPGEIAVSIAARLLQRRDECASYDA
jgi:xanthine dehydrogenase accessory factor